jgi:Omp85 superfamily domain
VKRWLTGVAAAVLLAAAAPPAAGQETRRDAIAAERAARSREVAPYEPGRLESTMLWAQKSPVMARFLNRGDGFYLVFGSLTRGAGMAFGAGWRQHFASHRLLLDTAGVASVRGYLTGRVELRMPDLAGGRVQVGTRARHRYYPQEDYFGLGPDSQKDARVNYRLSETEVAAFGLYRPARWFSASGQVAHLSPSIGSGTDSRYPSIETSFDESTAPGLSRQPAFLETGGIVEADFRDRPNNPKSGGRYSLLVARYDDRDGPAYDFTRTTIVVEHHLPIFDKKRVFSVRGLATRLGAGAGDTVPFYYMPAFGGRDTVRGFLDYRFRDRAWALLNAEYRWEAVSGVEMAMFYDVGDVKPRVESLSLRDVRSSYGLGVRFHTSSSIFMRTEVAFGSGEGTRAFVAFGAPLRVERYLR